MMMQAASRQQHQHQHQLRPLSAESGARSHQNQHRPAIGLAPKSASSAAAGYDVDFEDDANLRSGRFASALLFMAVLVLMVDASRIILYSWYTDGSYLKYLYGSETEIRWPKCGGSGGGSGSIGFGDDSGLQPSDQSPTTASVSSAAVVITAVSQKRSRPLQQPSQPDQPLDQFKDSLMGGLTLAGQLLDAFVGGDSGDSRPPPWRVPKPLVRVLFHASTVACLFFLAVAIFPAALRTRRGCCLLACSLVFSLATMLAAGASATASLMSVYFFSACELQPRLRRAYDFVPGCDALRRAFLGAECFSLIVICSAVCLLLHLQAYFCRALGTACGCCCRGCCGDAGGELEFSNNVSNCHESGDRGASGGAHEFELARVPGRRPRGPYDEEEYLA